MKKNTTVTSKAASAFGRMGGSVSSARKTEANRLNAIKRWEKVRAEQAKKQTGEQKAVAP